MADFPERGYGSWAQFRRRRAKARKTNAAVLATICECIMPPWTPCRHTVEWRNRISNRKNATPADRESAERAALGRA